MGEKIYFQSCLLWAPLDCTFTKPEDRTSSVVEIMLDQILELLVSCLGKLQSFSQGTPRQNVECFPVSSAAFVLYLATTLITAFFSLL